MWVKNWYGLYCNRKCPWKSSERIKKWLKLIKKYWVKYYSKLNECKEKIKQTFLKNRLSWSSSITQNSLKKNALSDIYNVNIFYKDWLYNVYCNILVEIQIMNI